MRSSFLGLIALAITVAAAGAYLLLSQNVGDYAIGTAVSGALGLLFGITFLYLSSHLLLITSFEIAASAAAIYYGLLSWNGNGWRQPLFILPDLILALGMGFMIGMFVFMPFAYPRRRKQREKESYYRHRQLMKMR